MFTEMGQSTEIEAQLEMQVSHRQFGNFGRQPAIFHQTYAWIPANYYCPFVMPNVSI